MAVAEISSNIRTAECPCKVRGDPMRSELAKVRE